MKTHLDIQLHGAVDGGVRLIATYHEKVGEVLVVKDRIQVSIDRSEIRHRCETVIYTPNSTEEDLDPNAMPLLMALSLLNAFIKTYMPSTNHSVHMTVDNGPDENPRYRYLTVRAAMEELLQLYAWGNDLDPKVKPIKPIQVLPKIVHYD